MKFRIYRYYIVILGQQILLLSLIPTIIKIVCSARNVVWSIFLISTEMIFFSSNNFYFSFIIYFIFLFALLLMFSDFFKSFISFCFFVINAIIILRIIIIIWVFVLTCFFSLSRQFNNCYCFDSNSDDNFRS